jgi:hypothetical protein
VLTTGIHDKGIEGFLLSGAAYAAPLAFSTAIF